MVVVVFAGVVLRCVSRGPLWLDEAQSVSIASVPVHELGVALRHDGSPPLWYLLLHFWMRLFGSSAWSVRLMSAVPGVLALPLVYRLGQRLGGRPVARLSLVFLAALPFAVRYSVEARMYSLVLVLGLVAAHLVLTVHERRPLWAVVALAASTSALLYTHYYALWGFVALGAWELWRAVRRKDRASVAVVGALIVGGASLAPWLPVLSYQAKHTGAPWGSAPSANAVLDTLATFVGGGSPTGRVVQLTCLLLLALAVAGRAVGGRIVLARPFAVVPGRLLAAATATVALAVLVDMLTDQAYAARYSTAIVGIFVVVLAFGVLAVPTVRARRVLVVGLVVAWLGLSAASVIGVRTQAGQIAAALRANVRPGDVVVYCPDQLGPSTSRLLPAGMRQYVYPSFAGPSRVDWVDYESRMGADVVYSFVTRLNRLAGAHTVWVVWRKNVEPLQGHCEDLMDTLSATRGSPPTHVVKPDRRNAELMQLDAFAPAIPALG